MQRGKKKTEDSVSRCFFAIATFMVVGCIPCSPPQSSTVRSQSAVEIDKSAKVGDESISAPLRFKITEERSSPVMGTETHYTPTHGVRLEQIAPANGLDFRYEAGREGKELIVETMGGGAAWLDFDRDGYQDIYLVQGGNPTRPADSRQPTDQIFRNVSSGGFVNVSEGSGVGDHGYGMGATAGDFDNDGFDDVFVTNFGSNMLYKNQGDGTFADITRVAGVVDNRWSSSAAWCDLDQDGDLDLFVCHYLKWHVNHPKICYKPDGSRDVCPPMVYDGEPDECFMNQGNGSFAPAGADRGLTSTDGKALGVAVADFNNDSHPDIFLAVDTRPNRLYLNNGKGRFQEVAVRMGCAVDLLGNPHAGMGIAVGDYDNNGYLDLYVTAFKDEYNALYQNLGTAGMDDVTLRVGLVKPTLPMLGFGTIMADLDQDGWPELFVANGHITDYRKMGTMFEMPPQVFTYREPNKSWSEISRETGDYSNMMMLGRGVASADFDNDGDLDLAVVPQDRSMLLLRNDSRRGHWLKVNCIGRQSNRNAIGCRISLVTTDFKLMQELVGGGSYCSSHEHTLIFGLGQKSSPCDLEIRWPNGVIQTLADVPVDQVVTVIEP